MVWQDKKSVFFINTVYNPTDHTEVKGRNNDGSQTILQCPTTVKNYNQFMGGVDVADAKRKAYSCSRRSRKWWLRLFYFVIDVCVVNTHILHNETKHLAKLNQKRFRLELAREMLACHSSRKHRKRGRTSSEGSSSRLNEQHFLEKLCSPLQCRFCSKTGERKCTSFGCKECNPQDPLPLCTMPCFRLHHTKWTKERTCAFIYGCDTKLSIIITLQLFKKN